MQKNPHADLSGYYKRSGATTHEGIVKWFEKCFTGRSRAICGLSEPTQWTNKSEKMFKHLVESSVLFSIDIDALEKDGLIEAVYVSLAITPNINDNLLQDCDEVLIKLNSVQEISCEPVNWDACDEKLGLRFSVIHYYLTVMKDGIIPPKYINLEKTK